MKTFLFSQFSNKYNLKWVTLEGKVLRGQLLFQKPNSTSYLLDQVAFSQSVSYLITDQLTLLFLLSFRVSSYFAPAISFLVLCLCECSHTASGINFFLYFYSIIIGIPWDSAFSFLILSLVLLKNLTQLNQNKTPHHLCSFK